MIFKSTHIDEVKIIKPTIFEDNRGFFLSLIMHKSLEIMVLMKLLFNQIIVNQ